ncbi:MULTISPECIES: DUF4262 domain-containing protein [unclassified Streptomyces]|uniref:DUF4262 domain-containing protein n=2 Tax=unclassified Streptomyces TaxID=2593676 RepID=UPI002E80EF5D|nr:DUF4262 domain-containing protein [Streptomyces sp. NBC_00562]WUC23220.1 DUF4262 domain-containing protein [Streptomyces sp. NBC_00562]
MTDDPFQCRCVLCHDYGDRDEDRADLTIIENVQQHGCHVVMVPEDEIGPGFAYTIGLSHNHGAPELAMSQPAPGAELRVYPMEAGASIAVMAASTDGSTR